MPDATSLIGGLLRGFNRTAATGRADAAAREEKQREREHSLLLHLATTSEDEGVADMAASALVESTMGGKRPKEGYFNRLIGGGPDATNPAVANIMALIRGGGVGSAGSGSGAGGVTPSAPAASAPPPGMGGAGRGPQPPGTPGQLTQSTNVMGRQGATSPVLLQPPPTVTPGPFGGKVQMPSMGMAQPPPQVNTPPDAEAAVEATQSPAGPVAAAAVAGGPAGGPPAVGGAPMAPPQPPPPVLDTLAQRLNVSASLGLSQAARQRALQQRHLDSIQPELAAQYNAALVIARASGLGEEEAQAAARRKVGIGGETGAMQEGDVVPDPLSNTGYSRVIWRNVDGRPQEVGRIPAPKPITGGPANQQAKEFARRSDPKTAIQGAFDPDTRKYFDETGKEVPDAIPYQKPERSTLTPGQRSNLIKDLAGEWTKATVDLRTAQQQTELIRAGANEARRTGQFNAATEAVRKGFAKLTDVASAVREAEFELGTRGQPLTRKFDGLLQKVSQGGIMLTQADLDEYVSVADELVKAYDTMALKGIRGRIERTADFENIPRSLVFYDQTTGVAAPEAPWVQMVNPATGKPEEVHPEDVQKAVAAGWKKVGGG